MFQMCCQEGKNSKRTQWQVATPAAPGKRKAVEMNARDAETFCLVQEMIGSSSSSSSSDSMQED
jgi:hypothetical protein